MDATDLASALKSAREEAGWTTTRTAFEIGIGENAVYKIEAGISNGSVSTVLALMRKLPGFAERLGFQPVQRAA